MQRKQKQKKATGTVTSIETEYVRSYQKKEDWRNRQKQRLKKKLLMYAVIAVVVLGGLTQMYVNQKQLLSSKEQLRAEMETKLSKVQEEQEQLKQQLVLLDDDEYIAKLARKELFLSEGNEIIFSIPENKDKMEKKEDRKE